MTQHLATAPSNGVYVGADYHDTQPEFRMSVSQRWLTVEDARRILDDHTYVHQRHIDEGHVRKIAGLIERGEFLYMQIDMAVLPDGTVMMVNGYHRCRALLAVAAERDVAPVEGLIVYHRCDNLAEVADIYATYDRPKVRTLPEMLTAMGLHERLGITLEDLRLTQHAAPLVLGDFTAFHGREDAYSPQVRRLFLEEWEAEVKAYLEATSGATREVRRMIRRAAVIAVAVVSLRAQPERARAFWSAVAGENGLLRDDPAAALLRFLRNTQADRHKPWIYARYVAACWNAAYQDRTLDKVMVRDEAAPIVIAGSRLSIGTRDRRR
jgi:hypothetical protein